jgi:hypothetical protein
MLAWSNPLTDNEEQHHLDQQESSYSFTSTIYPIACLESHGYLLQDYAKPHAVLSRNYELANALPLGTWL